MNFIYPKRKKSFLSGNRRIRQNVWGNWYGYIGTRKVQWFFDNSFGTQEEHAKRWLESFHSTIF